MSREIEEYYLLCAILFVGPEKLLSNPCSGRETCSDCITFDSDCGWCTKEVSVFQIYKFLSVALFKVGLVCWFSSRILRMQSLSPKIVIARVWSHHDMSYTTLYLQLYLLVLWHSLLYFANLSLTFFRVIQVMGSLGVTPSSTWLSIAPMTTFIPRTL